MSSVAIEAAPDAKPVGAWRVLLAFAGLAALAGAIGFLAFTRTGEVEPSSVIAKRFDARALPFGFVPRFAAKLPFGQELVRFAAPGTSFEVEPAPTFEPAKDSEQAKPGDAPKVDWRKLPIAPAGEPPSTAALLFLEGDAREQLAALIGDASFGAPASVGPSGGTAAIDAGTFHWDAYEPRWVMLRRYEPSAKPAAATSTTPSSIPTGTYVDEVRVDLSAHGRWCALIVAWPKGVTGSKEQAFELARAFTPKPPDSK